MAAQQITAARRLTIEETLQEYCDIVLDDATGVTWDLYRPDQKDKLELKVRLALFPESVSVNEKTGEVSESLKVKQRSLHLPIPFTECDS
jgi:hypothetical protein